MAHDHHYHHHHGHGAHHHHHDHDHDHGHHHHHHDGDNGVSAAPHHLHSHMDPQDGVEALQVLTTQFIDGYVQAKDKTSYLRLAGIDFERPGEGGKPSLKLVDVEIKTAWQVGTAGPAFGSKELMYMPYPGELVTERTDMNFVYVSLVERRDVDLRDILAARMAGDLADR